MSEAKRFMIGNTTCIIMDDCCSHPDQAERNARARKNIEEIVSLAYLADPEGFEKRGEERNKRKTPEKKQKKNTKEKILPERKPYGADKLV